MVSRRNIRSSRGRPAANREAARAVIPAELNLVELTMRAER
jgi:hypothetical protein